MCLVPHRFRDDAAANGRRLVGRQRLDRIVIAKDLLPGHRASSFEDRRHLLASARQVPADRDRRDPQQGRDLRNAGALELVKDQNRASPGRQSLERRVHQRPRDDGRLVIDDIRRRLERRADPAPPGAASRRGRC